MQRGDPHADDGAARCPLCRTAVRQADLFRWRCLPPHPPAPPSPYADAAEEEGAAAAAAVEVSTKMQMTLEAVREATAGGEKVLIFSCYTQFLDLLQRMLSHEQIACGRVDGTQTAEQRDAQATPAPRGPRCAAGPRAPMPRRPPRPEQPSVDLIR